MCTELPRDFDWTDGTTEPRMCDEGHAFNVFEEEQSSFLLDIKIPMILCRMGTVSISI